MKKPETLQEKWLYQQIELTKQEIKQQRQTQQDSNNMLIPQTIKETIELLKYNLKMEKVIYSQITNYSTLKSSEKINEM